MNKKLHILYVSPFDSAISGPDESLLTILRHLPQNRFKVSVIVPPTSPYIPKYKENSATVIPLPIERVKRSRNPLFWGSLILRFAVNTVKIKRILKKQRPDIVHVNMETTLSSAAAARLAGIPCLIHYRGNADRTKGLFIKLYLHILNILSDKIAAISKSVQNVFNGHSLYKKSVVLYNAFDTSNFKAKKSGKLRSLLKIAEDIPVAGSASRIHPRKRIDMLVETVAKLIEKIPSLVFVLIGDATSKEEKKYKKIIEEKIHALSINSKFVITGVREDINELLPDLDLFILCAEREGFGRTVLEAQACGVPCLVPAEGGPAEIVEHNSTGIIVDSDDTSVWAEKASELLKNPEKLKKMSKYASEKTYERFSAENAVKILEQIYTSMSG